MDVKLHLVKGNPQGKQVEVPAGTLTVGRAEDSDLIIASTRVSRHHCEIVNEHGRLIVRDKSSGNGTFVNGQKVDEQPLAPGDELQIGPLTFAVEIGGVRQAAKAPAAAAKSASPKPATPKPAPAKPASAPQAKAKLAAKPAAGKRASPDDIFASLERMAGGKKKDEDKDDDLGLSDTDSLGSGE
jgi:pSer/pThr/pTyr-binding forkhead associated (FHA) protein